MVVPDLVEMLAAAEGLTILDQATGAMRPFRPNREQRRILKKICRTRRLIVGKARQIGCSTIVAYFMTWFAMKNPGVPCCIVADDQDNANKILGHIKRWLVQMGVKLIKPSGVESITLENGARIDALTAISPAEDGQSRVGRSGSYGFIHATEMAYWRSDRAVWAALTSTKLVTAIYVVESTGSPGGELFKSLVTDPTGWDLHFIGVEAHENYRADPNSISDETWEQLRDEYGFVRRDSAAWWWDHLRVDLKGDVFAMLREFPVAIPHMFMFQQGQHIQAWREVPVRIDGFWNVYVEVPTEPIIFGVDTATGVAKDASAIAMLGQNSGRLLRTFRRNTIVIPDFIKLVREQVDVMRPVATVVESNGVGAGVWQDLAFYPIARAVEHKSSGRLNQNDSELHKRRAEMKGIIESGQLGVGGDLVFEVKNSVVTPRATFEGPDDLLSATSFAWMWRKLNPWRAPVEEVDPRLVYISPLRRQESRIRF